MDNLVLTFCLHYMPKNCQFFRLAFLGLKKNVLRERKFFSFFLFILLLLEKSPALAETLIPQRTGVSL